MDYSFINHNRKVLLDCLSGAIRGRKYEHNLLDDVDWEALISEAEKHQVMTLIYPALSNIACNMPELIRENLRKESLYIGMKQEQNCRMAVDIFRMLADEKTQFIALKGLVMRKLYPYPEMRVLTDIDLLVHSKDIDNIGILLESKGYKKYVDYERHVSYSHDAFWTIEIHKALSEVNQELLREFESDMWDRAISVNFYDMDILSLCAQDNLLHICLHMASHILSNGFGLKQLCDFVVAVECYWHDINWNEFFSLANSCGLEQFVRTIFSICHVFFNLEIPEAYTIDINKEMPLIKSVAEDIFDGGVFGGDDMERNAANRMLQFTSGEETGSIFKMIYIYIKLIFPSVKMLGTMYSYAKNNKLLLPIAWFHRFFHFLIRKDIPFAEKTATFTSSKPKEIYSKRSDMLKKLGLLD